MNYLGEPRKLGDWLSDPAAPSADGWLYLKADISSLDLTTLCWPVIVESKELSDDGYEEMELWLKKNNFKPLLCKGQMEDIVENLHRQLSAYTDTQLLKAILHYWENDAYIDATNA